MSIKSIYTYENCGFTLIITLKDRGKNNACFNGAKNWDG